MIEKSCSITSLTRAGANIANVTLLKSVQREDGQHQTLAGQCLISLQICQLVDVVSSALWSRGKHFLEI